MPHVVPGSDLAALLLAAYLKPRERVTIVGLRPARLAALVRRCGLTEVAHYDPPMGFEHDTAALQAAVAFVVANPARFILLAVGSPRQEVLAEAIAASGLAHGVGLCVGASLDFLSGAETRAPEWMQRAGLEWLHRLAADPRRLAWRYLVEDPMVFGLLIREWRDAADASKG